MLKIKIAVFFSVLIFITLKSYPQNDTLNTFEYDYCLFKGENSKSIIELYYSFKQYMLNFIKDENGYEADGKLSLTVTDLNLNKAVINKEYKVPLSIKDTAGYNKNTSLLGQLNVILDTGSYKFEIKGGDYNNPANTTGNSETF